MAKLPYRFSKGEKKHPRIPGFVNINATSGSNSWTRGLSPMILGPFTVTEDLAPSALYPDGILPGFTYDSKSEKQTAVVKNFENYHQASKVMNIDIDADGYIKRQFFERRAKLFADPKPHRRALPKKVATPVASYFDGRIMNYLQSRILAYCPYYAYLVQLSDAYKRLKQMVDNGTNVLILDYDVVDVPITEESMEREILDPSRPYGHGNILACLLVNIEPWNSPNILTAIK